MKVAKNLLPWLLIASSVIIASITYRHQASLDEAKAADKAAQQDNKQPAATTNQANAFSSAEAPIQVTYQCDDQNPIRATYSAINSNLSNVTLHINGQQYQLYRVPSQVGKLYATEQGINPGQGMRWHVQGLEARLVTMTLDHTATADKEQLLMRCQQPV